MKEKTHAFLAYLIAAAREWTPGNCQTCATAAKAVDVATPPWVGKRWLDEHGYVAVPTQMDVMDPAQLRDRCHHGFRALGIWHGSGVGARVQVGIVAPEVKPLLSSTDPVAFGMALHALADTAAHAGFFPGWSKDNACPGYSRPWWQVWRGGIPPILHAQHLDGPDLLGGIGLDSTGMHERYTSAKVAEAVEALAYTLPVVRHDRISAVSLLCYAATSDTALCKVAVELLAAWGYPEPHDRMPAKTADFWRQFFAVARGV